MRVVERRSTVVDPLIWPTLQASPEFWDLRERKLLEVVQDGPDEVRLRGSSWVGRAAVDGITVSFDPKVSGALEALFSFATHGSFRIEEVPSTLSDLGDLAVLLIRQLLKRARAYLGNGGDFDYLDRMETGSLVAGRLDIPQTLALRAQGHRNQAAFWRQEMTQDTALNRVLLASLRQVEILANGLPLTVADMMRSRELARLLDDARSAAVLFGERSRWVKRANLVASGSGVPDHRDIAALAAVVLAHESFERDADAGTSPRAWFLNLETLFEEALRRALAREWVGASVTRATGYTPIFDVAVGYNADPDVLVRESDELICVGDAKYRDWPGAASPSMHSEVYQLLTHAKAYEADRAFLAYPAERFAMIDLGVSVTGCHVWAFALDLKNLGDSAQRLLERVRLG